MPGVVLAFRAAVCIPVPRSLAALLLAGVVALLGGANAAAALFANTNAIVINDSNTPPTPATPYPSRITVTGLTGQVITKLTVQIQGFAHGFPDDVCVVLVGPHGTNCVLMSNCGAGIPGVTNIDLTLDDAAATSLPTSQPLVSGTFKPTQRQAFSYLWPSPAPPSPAAPSLANFINTDPNGNWGLFVIDDFGGSDGVIQGGWALNLSTAAVPALSILAAGDNVILSWPNVPAGFSLQSAPSFQPGTTWTNVPGLPAVVSGQCFVTNPIAGAAAFYRLAH